MKRILGFLLAVASTATVVSCSNDASTGTTTTTSTQPTAHSADSTSASTGSITYACPMHPEVTSTQPGQKCSKCGMELVQTTE